jgi:hypothetical protein
MRALRFYDATDGVGNKWVVKERRQSVAKVRGPNLGEASEWSDDTVMKIPQWYLDSQHHGKLGGDTHSGVP